MIFNVLNALLLLLYYLRGFKYRNIITHYEILFSSCLVYIKSDTL